MQRSELAVVIPTYNAARFLRRTLESVFTQDRLPDEVILSDDCSRDGTQDLAGEIARSSPVPVRFISSPRNSGGPAEPLNRGIASSKCEFIATLDQDDWLLPHSIRNRYELIVRRPDLSLVFGRARSENVEGGPVTFVVRANACLDEMPKASIGEGQYVLSRQIAYEFLHSHLQYTISCSNLLFRRSAWEAVGGFPKGIHSACDFGFLQAVSARYDMGFVDAETFHWHRRTDNLSVTIGPRGELDWARLYGRFDPRCVRAESRDQLQRRMRTAEILAWLACGYLYRNGGHYGQALRYYLLAGTKSGAFGRALMGICKLPVHWAAHAGRGQAVAN